MGYAFKFAHRLEFPAMPQDRADSLAWVKETLPALLEGWKEGQGSPRYKGQALRVMPGESGRVYEGIKVLGEDSYKAEKLVYQL
ncbi:hypothetical protein QFC20_006440 [Naganishia adeliensis]|uniref:Uncharacterized protein n=1 Tax=Naganishia adeliensis TaxID=92952 RepID=A0ACC2VCL3_9TREE|nr:hypothetical protein QFC20_006440 [Naganishia adeliensis]